MPAVSTPLLTRDFVLLLSATFGAMANYATLLSVVPLWAASGGADDGWVGATIGVMMAATVVTQLAMGMLFRVLTLRRMLVLGSALLALATPAYAVSDAIAPLLAISAIRGVGFAFVVVAGAAITAELVAAERLSTAAGIYGLATGMPSVAVLPAGVWLAQTWGFEPVFLITSALALVAVPLAAAMSGGDRHPHVRPIGRPGIATWLKFIAPTAVFFATTLALGGTTTFLPLAEPQPGTAAVALFALSLAMVLGRLGAGRLGDRLQPGRLLLPAAGMSVLGMAGIAMATATEAAALTVVAAAVFGIGFGAAQNDSLVLVLHRSGPGGHRTASTVWNIAYDSGMGFGAVLFGVVVSAAGFAWAFAVMAIGIAVLAPTAWRVGARSHGEPLPS
jgi:predicted MFS family arabinose efflux permease